MGSLLFPPEHPAFPKEAKELRDPHRPPSEHEQRILAVFLKYKTIPDFAQLAPPDAAQIDAVLPQIDRLRRQPPDAISDQDTRLLDLLGLISAHPAVFGSAGYQVAAELIGAYRSVAQSCEFRAAFFREYQPMIGTVRQYLRQAAELRRRAGQASYSEESVPPGQWGSDLRWASAQAAMEEIRNLPDCYVMEKFWKTLEIICAYPDFFSAEQYERLSAQAGIEQAWRAHLFKARQDWTYYQSILHTGQLFRQMADSTLEALETIARQRLQAAALLGAKRPED